MGDFWVYKKKAEEEEASDALAVAISHAQQTFHCSHNFPFIQFARDLLLLIVVISFARYKKNIRPIPQKKPSLFGLSSSSSSEPIAIAMNITSHHRPLCPGNESVLYGVSKYVELFPIYSRLHVQRALACGHLQRDPMKRSKSDHLMVDCLADTPCKTSSESAMEI